MKEDKKFSKGGRVGYEHGDEVILPQEKPIFQTDAQASEGNPGNKELGSPVKTVTFKYLLNCFAKLFIKKLSGQKN